MRFAPPMMICTVLAVAAPAGASSDFRDCPDCPEMVRVPAGHFTMGARANEPGHTSAELPAHLVVIRAPFAIGKFDVTGAQFSKFADATGYTPNAKCDWHAPRAHGQPMNQSDADPVVCVSWGD